MAMRSVCLLSGGLDSSVALGLLGHRGEVALALTVDYGQRAAAREIEAARRIARHFGVAHQAMRLELYRGREGGALLDAARELPHPDRRSLDAGGPPMEESAARVWVPNRNGVLVQVAAAVAESLGAGVVGVGFNREEAATFPDNGEEFLAAASLALYYSTRNHVRLMSPTAALDKREIVAAARDLGAPIEHMWPCYEGGAEICGRCESCRRFRRALELAPAGVPPRR
jgi:7-cyano-7-deazaguanine synthase